YDWTAAREYPSIVRSLCWRVENGQLSSIGINQSSLPRLIPIDLHVVRRPADSDDVRTTVAVQVAGGKILDGDTAGIDDLPRPFRAGLILRIVDAHAALERIVEIVADADDELLIRIAVE